jgi:hypothetical protein
LADKETRLVELKGVKELFEAEVVKNKELREQVGTLLASKKER